MLRLIRHQSTRIPPKSLIIKQNKRLNQKPTGNSNLIISSLRDVGSLFQATSHTQEDDDLEQLTNSTLLLERLNSGELESLLKKKFDFDESTGLLSTNEMVKSFPLLKEDELELLKKASDVENEKPWSSVPNFIKQAQFYLSFGSHGPRDGMSFTVSERPSDFTFLRRARSASDPRIPCRKLKKSEMVNLYAATPARQAFFDERTIDPISRLFVWSAVAVSIAVGWKEYQVRKSGESFATVVDKNPV
ncbi:hypothetical protein HG536_0H03740 [Torulaspora globosa]|uniref:Genetic interactor of prohibitin 7, mitochondrial n=1 Tax=Torulaspora globosa TaxID=48254 RepID=A0A7G3ZNB2_9SACH|nr:uncharacterized protein HG536_0H03740 [Torulaspora globosa]QLL34998.1 hypothetical protein HG536_0H03740 [Torulaspora globosa]